jgi:glutathione S-transferase
MGLSIAGVDYEHREIIFKNKPTSMLTASPKGTVPVLVFDNGTVLEESLDILLWSLDQNDPNHWLPADATERQTQLKLIKVVEDDFKPHLDRYKYSNRYPEEKAVATEHREIGLKFLASLEERLLSHAQLFGDDISLADIATFPFVRQFANTDRDWFNAQPLPNLQKWLADHLDSDLFKGIMGKYELWVEGELYNRN